MSFPNFPDAARRAKLIQAHTLRQQGFTLRQIAAEMNCAHSTVAGYLADFELFRNDLIRELAADQLVSHLIQLADIADEHHARRLAAVRELRLLLASLPTLRRDETDRTLELVQAGVAVDRYGNRYPKPDRFYPPTPEELAQIEQPAPPAQPTQPEPARTASNDTDQSPPPPGEVSRSDGGGTATDTNEPDRTQSNKPEHDHTPTPAHNGASSQIDQNHPSPLLSEYPPELLDALVSETLEIFPHLKGQSDYDILNFLEQFTDPDVDVESPTAWLRAEVA